MRIPYSLIRADAVPRRWARSGTDAFSRLPSRLSSSSSPTLIVQNYVRLSQFWLASGGISPSEHEDAHAKLIRAGFLRQSHAGIFHILPLGQRVQQKLEALIDRYMLCLGASKVSLSSISSQALWEESGRLSGYGPELFRFTDRRDIHYLLAPTHEEEITTLVAKSVRSYKSLPLRLYQIGRKYRDEMRPRHGVLRSREFIMKDLYTFDCSLQSALVSYEEVRAAYCNLFDELRLPFLVAEASSGDIGGDLSHEYHLPTLAGEDNVVNCQVCDYVANEEVASCKPGPQTGRFDPKSLLFYQSARVWRGISKDRKTLVNVWYPTSTGAVDGHTRQPLSSEDINTHAVKSVLPDLDLGLENPVALWKNGPDQSHHPTKLVNVIDYRLGQGFVDYLHLEKVKMLPRESELDSSLLDSTAVTETRDGKPLNTLRIRNGDACPRCDSGQLQVQRAIELGHTFHLGTRYSEPLQAHVQIPDSLVEAGPRSKKNEIGRVGSSDAVSVVPIQMGCHGIGVSRIVGAVAHHLADDKGLNWPRVIAPFDVLVIPGRGAEADATTLSENLAKYQTSNAGTPGKGMFDVALDDRRESLSWKMKDAELIGYPIVIVLGRRWDSERLCEIQCRRLSLKTHVSLEGLPDYLSEVLSQL